MRWPKQKPWHPSDDCGKTRIKTRFLLIPKCIEDEWRWLEIASWEQEYGYKWHNEDTDHYGWVNTRWMNVSTRLDAMSHHLEKIET